VRRPRLRSMYQALIVCNAIGVPLLFYAVGSPTLGGALLLSSVLVFAVLVVKSGALATSWLGRHTITSIREAARLELAKAMICGALAVDLPQGSGNGRTSGRRVGVTPLTRRCRASALTHERPGYTENTLRGT
jgi:hypothetical protein